MKLSLTQIVLFCGICIPCVAAFGDVPTVTAVPETGNSFYVSADCYGIKGNGPLDNFVLADEFDFKPSGVLYGATVGYEMNKVVSGTMNFELTYLKGDPDASIYALYGDDGDVYQEYESYVYRYDIKKVRLSASYTPDCLNFLTFGVALVHYDTRINMDFRFGYVDESADYSIHYDTSYTSTDLLVAAALHYSDFHLVSNTVYTLSLVPSAKIGVGYSFRSFGDKLAYGADYDYFDYHMSGSLDISDMEKELGAPDDAPVYECETSLGLVYKSGKCAASILGGYRYESDLDDSDNYFEGFFGRLEFKYSL
jgi:hypothetical protein